MLAHLRLHRTFVHVVVAEQVQHGVDAEVTQLAGKAVSELVRLRLRALDRDAHVAQRHGVGAGIPVGLRRMLAGPEVKHREAQNVGGAVDAAHLAVDLLNAFVVREQDIDLARQRHALERERGVDRFFEQRGKLVVEQLVHIGFDGHQILVLFHDVNLFIFSCFSRPRNPDRRG